MTVAVCIPTRGRPELVKQAIEGLLTTSELGTTRIVVGIDEDEGLSSRAYIQSPKVFYAKAPREETLGAKWNRCAAALPRDPDLFVIWADDITIITPGWDKKLLASANLFNGGVGFIYFGNIQGTLQTGIAVTRKYVETAGYFCPPYFPFWWCDTWTDEIARLTGRVVQCDVTAKLLQKLEGNSRGLRDIVFWGNFFQKTRIWRKEIANRIINESDDPPWRKEQIRQFWPSLEVMLDYRDSPNRDPATAKRFETQLGFDAPDDERYQSAKVKAEKLLLGMA